MTSDIDLRLAGNAILRTREGVELRFASAGRTFIRIGCNWVLTGTQTLALVTKFASAQRCADVLSSLSADMPGKQAAIELIVNLKELVRLGVIVFVSDDASFSGEPGFDGVASTTAQIAMLDDVVRTSSWLQAVKSVVTPGDIVVDIGTGSGILAIAAAIAGAKQVFAVESSRIAKSAEHMVQNNRVAPQVTIVRGWSRDVVIEQQADVLLSEILGHSPFAEGLLASLSDAKERLGKPTARCIPARLRLFAVPVKLSREWLSKQLFLPEKLRQWALDYDMDFAGLGSMNPPFMSTLMRQEVVSGWPKLSEPKVIVDVDFASHVPKVVEGTHDFRIDSGCHDCGVALYFEAVLTKEISVWTDPWASGSARHWRTPIWSSGETCRVAPGRSLRFSYRFDGRELVTFGPADKC